MGWGTPQNFFWATIDELEKQLFVKKNAEVGPESIPESKDMKAIFQKKGKKEEKRTKKSKIF